jgi:nitric oxide reductase activation protein
MKKLVAAMAVLAIFAVVTFTSCAKSKVSKALDAYEKVVVQMEKTSLKDTASLKKLGKDAAAAADEIDDLEDSETWTKSEEKRYEKLTERFEKASAKMLGK